MSMIGQRCGIYIKEQGRLTCTGRMIVSDDCMLFTKGNLQFGEHFNINSFSRIVAHEQIEIGDHVTLGQMVSILDHDHRYVFEGKNMSLDGYLTSPVKIGDNVWIGDKSMVLRGVTIGSNVVVGANTLIHKDVPDNCVIGGSPFKILKKL